MNSIIPPRALVSNTSSSDLYPNENTNMDSNNSNLRSHMKPIPIPNATGNTNSSGSNSVMLEPLSWNSTSTPPVKPSPILTAIAGSPKNVHEEFVRKLDSEEEKRQRVLLNDKLLHDKLNQGLAMNHKYNASNTNNSSHSTVAVNPFAITNNNGHGKATHNPFSQSGPSSQHGRLSTIGIADPRVTPAVNTTNNSNGATMHKFSLWKGGKIPSLNEDNPHSGSQSHPGLQSGSIISTPSGQSNSHNSQTDPGGGGGHLLKPLSNSNSNSGNVTPNRRGSGTLAPSSSCSSNSSAGATPPTSGSKMASKLRGITSDNIPDLTDRILDGNSGTSTPVVRRSVSNPLALTAPTHVNKNDSTMVMQVLAHSFSMAGTTSALLASSTLPGDARHKNNNSSSGVDGGNDHITQQLSAQFDRLHCNRKPDKSDIIIHGKPDGMADNDHSDFQISGEEDDMVTEITKVSDSMRNNSNGNWNNPLHPLNSSNSDEYEEDRDSPALSEMSQSIDDVHSHSHHMDTFHSPPKDFKEHNGPNPFFGEKENLVDIHVKDSEMIIPASWITNNSKSTNIGMNMTSVSVSADNTPRKANPFASPGLNSIPPAPVSAPAANPFARTSQQSPLVSINANMQHSSGNGTGRGNSFTGLIGSASATMSSSTAMMMLNSGSNPNSLANGMFPNLSTNGKLKSNPDRVNVNSAIQSNLNTKSNTNPNTGTAVIRSQDKNHNSNNNNTTTSTLKWKKGKNIGEGSFGYVFQGMNIHTGELLAIKQLPLADGSKEEVRLLEKEIEVMWDLEHVNIVKYIGTSRSASYLYIILEYITGGSIASILKEFGPCDEKLILKYTFHILNGVQYLHQKGIIHRDIKGANVLVTENGVAKLADFGCSKRLAGMCTTSLEESLKVIKGSVPWMAPEVIKQSGYGRSSDIWSIGATLIEMATAKLPWPNFTNDLAALFHVATATKPPPVPTEVSTDCGQFITCCMSIDPKKRPTATELINHVFLSAMRQTGGVSTAPVPPSLSVMGNSNISKTVVEEKTNNI